MGEQNINNSAFYNFSTVASFLFYLFIFKEVVYSPMIKKIILFLMIGYGFASLYNIFFVQGILVFHSITYSIGCFMIVAVSIYYFLELFQRPRYVNLKREPAFWIVSGLLFFYACTPAIFGVINYLISLPDMQINAVKLMPLITILNVSLYSLFTIGFLCRINFRRSTS